MAITRLDKAMAASSGGFLVGLLGVVLAPDGALFFWECIAGISIVGIFMGTFYGILKS
jgi:hypothetical protein